MRGSLLVAGVALGCAAVACGGDDFTSQPATASSGSGAGASSASSGSAGAGASGSGGGGGEATGGSGGTGGSAGSGGAGGDDPCGAGFTCAPPVPAGWSGPALLYAGADAPPSCDPIFTTSIDAHAGALDAPYSCAPCACGAVAGVTCSKPTISAYGSLNCSGAVNTFAAPNGCSQVSGYESMKATASTPIGGSCAPSGGAAAIGELTWTLQARLCADPSASRSCGEDGVCAPEGAAPFKAAVCVYSDAGVTECPDGYSNEQTIHQTVEDTRGCSACTCGAPSGVDCSGNLTAHPATSSCANQGVTVSGCVNANAVGSFQSVEFVSAPEGGTCLSGGGEQIGKAEPAGTLLICCAPAG